MRSWRQRKFDRDMDAKTPRRTVAPLEIANTLAISPQFTVDHIFDPTWQTSLAFPMPGRFEDKAYGKESLAWLKAELLTGSGDMPLTLIEAKVTLGAFVLTVKYQKKIREAFSFRPYAGLMLTFTLEGEPKPRQLRCGFIPKRSHQRR